MLLSDEKADVERVLTNVQLDESEPTPPLPAFNHETAPSYLKCDIADQGSSFVSITFTPTNWLSRGMRSASMLSSSVSLTIHAFALLRSVSESSYQTTKLGVWSRSNF